MTVLALGRLTVPVAGSGRIRTLTMPPEFAPLATVLEAYLAGALPRLRESVSDGADVVETAGYVRRPAPGTDLTGGADRWRGATGGDLGDDVYLVGTPTGNEVAVPRQTLGELLRQLDDVTGELPHPPRLAELHPDVLRDLERQAAHLESLSIPGSGADPVEESALRRLLLAQFDAVGLPDDGGEAIGRLRRLELPVLESYAEAFRRRREYLASPQRHAAGGDRWGEPALSLDWFRAAEPPPEGWEAAEWTAYAEASFRASTVGPGGAGEFFVRHGGPWYAVRWRRDDGVIPVLLSMRAATA